MGKGPSQLACLLMRRPRGLYSYLQTIYTNWDTDQRAREEGNGCSEPSTRPFLTVAFWIGCSVVVAEVLAAGSRLGMSRLWLLLC